jgi:hypothetical protein
MFIQHFVHGLGTKSTEYLDMSSRGVFVHCIVEEGNSILDRILSVTPLEDLQIKVPLISEDEPIITYPDDSDISALPAREELLQLTAPRIGSENEVEDPTLFPLSIEENCFDNDIGNSSKAPSCDLKDLKFELARQDLEEFMASKENFLELSTIISRNWSTVIEEDDSYIRIYPNSKTICYCLQGFLFQTVCYDPRVGLNILLLDEASDIDMQPLMPSTKILQWQLGQNLQCKVVVLITTTIEGSKMCLEYHIFYHPGPTFILVGVPLHALLRGTDNGEYLNMAVGHQEFSTSFVRTVNHAAEDEVEEDLLQQVMTTTLEEELSLPCLDVVADYFSLAEEEVEFQDLEQVVKPETSPVELKQLPPGLQYVFMNGDSETPVIISDKLSNDETQRLVATLEKYWSVIGYSLQDLKGISLSLCTHHIPMEQDHKPICEHQRRLNNAMREVVKKEVLKLLMARVIYPVSDSEWVSPVQVVPKKGGMTVIHNEKNELIPQRTVTGWRTCIDYRKLNKATWKDHFSLPFIDEMLERLANHSFCYLDGYSGYPQISIHPDDQSKTTFTCPYDTFTYRRMPFGLCNAPTSFQRCMMVIFSNMIVKVMEVFMDDFSVYGKIFEDCLANLDKVLKRCQMANLVLN